MTTEIDATNQEQHDMHMECVHRETEEINKWDIALGSAMAAVILVDHTIFTFNALLVFLIIQIMRYKIEICDAVFVSTYRLQSMTDRMDYMNATQFNRISLKFSTYILLIGLTGIIYAVTANPSAHLLVKWCVALATIFV
jgi:hypothetical protein